MKFDRFLVRVILLSLVFSLVFLVTGLAINDIIFLVISGIWYFLGCAFATVLGLKSEKHLAQSY